MAARPKGIVRWDLNAPGRRARFLLIGGTSILLYVVFVVSGYTARTLAASLAGDKVALAARIDPFNAAFEHILGRIAFFERQDFAGAALHYQRATRLNAYSARYWLDLANSQQLLGQPEQARRSLEHALAVDPSNPQVANEAANYFLVLGDLNRALSLLGMVAQHSPADAHGAIQLSWRATQDPRAVIDRVLPRSPEAYFTLLNILLERRETAAAAKVWRALLDLKQPVPLDGAFSYIDYLLHEGEVAPAKETWDQMVRRDASLRGYATGENLAANGGFEEDVVNGGFGWRYQSSPHVTLAVDQHEAYRGRRSLSIAFDGEPIRDAGIFEFIVVQPNTEYSISAKVKTETMEGAGGPQIAISDHYSGTQLFLSPDLSGETGWRDMQGMFRTGPEAKLVTVQVVRVPGTTRIRGKLWLDEVAVYRK